MELFVLLMDHVNLVQRNAYKRAVVLVSLIVQLLALVSLLHLWDLPVLNLLYNVQLAMFHVQHSAVVKHSLYVQLLVFVHLDMYFVRLLRVALVLHLIVHLISPLVLILLVLFNVGMVLVLLTYLIVQLKPLVLLIKSIVSLMVHVNHQLLSVLINILV
jgi:hypothetical protein